MVMCTASLPDQYRAKFERSYTYVRHMRKRGITKGQRTRIAEAIGLIAVTPKDASPPSTQTVMQWMRDYEKSGSNPASLVSRNVKRRTSKKLSPAVLQIAEKVLARHYFVRNGCTLREVHDKVLRDLERAVPPDAITEADSSISLSTIRRLASETSPFDRDRARLGPAQARAKWRFSKPGVYATRPLERVEMDHTLLDLVVIDDALGIPLGRPVITLLVCSFSGYILGFFISFEGETVGRVVQSIKVAVQPKDSITANQGLSNPWHAMGLWETLVLDNSLSFHSGHLRHIASDLCMDVEYCPVRMPWLKPSVERLLGELTRQLPAHGRPKKPGTGPDPINPNDSACITFSDLCSGILQWVVDVHTLQIHQQKKARPMDLFLDGLTSCPAPMLIDDSANLDVIAGLSAWPEVTTVPDEGEGLGRMARKARRHRWPTPRGERLLRASARTGIGPSAARSARSGRPHGAGTTTGETVRKSEIDAAKSIDNELLSFTHPVNSSPSTCLGFFSSAATFHTCDEMACASQTLSGKRMTTGSLPLSW
ncbi:hypothetical protein SAMD00023378_0935 [Ralstonia sp. NT80]|nr:hypothetical protein SAMD00023378_0935 [Ralstonia sp. NT80]